MDERELDAAIADLLQKAQYAKAEEILRRVHAEALQNNQIDLAVSAL